MVLLSSLSLCSLLFSMLVQRLQLPPGRKAPHTLFLIKGLLKTAQCGVH